MPRITPVDPTNPPADTAPQLAAVRAKLGRVPNLLATLAHAPVALNAYLGLADTVAKSTLSAQDRERIALTVGEANGCDYCLAAHTLIGKGAGLSEAEIRAAREAEAANPRSRAIVRLARAIVDTRGRIADVQLEEARRAGLTEGEVLEVLTIVVVNLLTNYANNLARTEVDFPQAAPLARAA